MVRDLTGFEDGRSLSYGFEGARPRAATVSMCRYTIPDSPICKPSLSPPNSPPSLILPPTGQRGLGLQRSISRLSCLEERLASSAPSGPAGVLSFGSEHTGSVESVASKGPFTGPSGTSPEFTLLEEEECGVYERHHPSVTSNSSLPPHFVGLDDGDDEAIASPPESAEAPYAASFSASPVLISCLRDIANSRRH